MAKVFNSNSVDTYVNNEWTSIYTFNNTSNKAIVLSILASNVSTSDITISFRIVNGSNVLKYPIISNHILSSTDEYTIDKMKKIFVLYPGWSIQGRFSNSGVVAYVSALEGVQ